MRDSNNKDNANNNGLSKEKVWIVIPAYNEEKRIGKVIKDLHNHGYSNIIVVDDCSNDNTMKVAKQYGAIVLKHIINRGQGAALKTGIKYALKKGAGIIVTFDADGQHIAKDIPKLINAINQGYDVALGNRFMGNNTNIPKIKKLILKGGALLMRIFYGVNVGDSHNGLRAFSREAAMSINITQDRMEHASEIIEEIARNKLSYKEVPVTIIYDDYAIKKGQSIFNSINILMKMISKLIKSV